MTKGPEIPVQEFAGGPRIVVIGVGGAGGNAVNNMIKAKLAGVHFAAANTDAQALGMSLSETRIQIGRELTQGLGAGSRPDIGRSAAEETLDEVLRAVEGANMVFITAGMGGGTGSAPVIAKAAREAGILTIGVVTKPFHFEGTRRMALAEAGIDEMAEHVDTLIVIPNQNLFRIANDKTTFADAFKMADDVLHAGVRGVTDLMVTPGLINLDFADVRTVMTEMGKAIMGSGEAEGENRALSAAEAAIANPLLDEISMKGARGVLINITGGMDLTLFEIDQAANRIRDEVDPDANIIFGSTFDDQMSGRMRVSLVAAGIDADEARRDDRSRSKRPIVSLYSEQLRTAAREDAQVSGPEPEDASDPETSPAKAEDAPVSGLDHDAAPAGDEDEGEVAEQTAEAVDEATETKPPRRASAPVFPFRARPRERKPMETSSSSPLRAASPHPREAQDPAPEDEAAWSGPKSEPGDDFGTAPFPPREQILEQAGLEPDTVEGTAASEDGAPYTKPALFRDDPAEPDAAVGARAESEPASDSGSQVAPAATPITARQDGGQSRTKKSGGFFSWISSGGDAAEDFFKKADRYYHGQGVRKNLELAFKSYLKAAESGHPGAQNRVGWMYEKGEGVEVDHAAAVKWYRKSADQGYVNAMNDLGYMYRQGWGVPQNHHEALLWFEQAASKYDSYAEYNMGQMFENGWGVERDMEEAVRWFRRSAARGHEWAAKRLEELGVKT